MYVLRITNVFITVREDHSSCMAVLHVLQIFGYLIVIFRYRGCFVSLLLLFVVCAPLTTVCSRYLSECLRVNSRMQLYYEFSLHQHHFCTFKDLLLAAYALTCKYAHRFFFYTQELLVSQSKATTRTVQRYRVQLFSMLADLASVFRVRFIRTVVI